MDADTVEVITYQANLYYGIHYSAAMQEDVSAAIASDDVFKKLTEGEIGKDKELILMNTNSDFDERVTRGVILADSMTQEGPEMGEPSACSIIVDYATMKKLEKDHQKVMAMITTLYGKIIAYFKKNKLSVKAVYLGWMVVNYEWDDNDSSED